MAFKLAPINIDSLTFVAVDNQAWQDLKRNAGVDALSLEAYDEFKAQYGLGAYIRSSNHHKYFVMIDERKFQHARLRHGL